MMAEVELIMRADALVSVAKKSINWQCQQNIITYLLTKIVDFKHHSGNIYHNSEV